MPIEDEGISILQARAGSIQCNYGSMQKSSRSYIIIGVFLSSFVSLICCTALTLHIVGMDNLAIHLSAGYAYKIILIAMADIAVLGLLLGTAVRLIRNFGNNTRIQPLLPLLAAALIIDAAALTGVIFLPPIYHDYMHGAKPTAPEELIWSVGPSLGFIGEGGHGLDVKTRSVWWFDPGTSKDRASLLYGTRPVRDMMQPLHEIPDGDGKRHEVRFQNLSPSTTYYYTIPVLSDEIFSFVTPPDSENSENFHFLCIGDSTNHGRYGHSFFGEISMVARRFYDTSPIEPSFLLLLGDIAHHGRDLLSWEYFFLNGKDLLSRYPTITVPGNHELYDDHGGNLHYFFRQSRYFSFDYGNAHFLIINTFDGFGGINGMTGKDQYNFIRDDLRKNSGKKWIIVGMHVPPISTGDFGMNELLKKQYLDLFSRYRVDLVLMGHDHHYEAFWIDRDTDWNGTLYVINGGGGSRLDDYIMTRKNRQWKTWYHDRNSAHGLYQHDAMTEKYHLYGELSWGFLDVHITRNSLTTTYYRWLSMERFLSITGQDPQSWTFFPLDRDTWNKNRLSYTEEVHRLVKTRSFP